ncbi:MAG TPA: hypothetical protein ENH86_02610 [Candidatus Jorgensenbacteria bacterium]|nr:hypothetical protein [Candidatus Jorgensenbacteria bacterium]
MVDQKLPGFIFFDEAGYRTPIISTELAKRITVGFLQKGYRGGLRFFKDCYGNCKFDNPARCDIASKPWHGGPASYEEGGPQPARIKIEWEGKYGGEEEDIAPIVTVCRSLNLREYTLAEPVEAAAS